MTVVRLYAPRSVEGENTVEFTHCAVVLKTVDLYDRSEVKCLMMMSIPDRGEEQDEQQLLDLWDQANYCGGFGG